MKQKKSRPFLFLLANGSLCFLCVVLMITMIEHGHPMWESLIWAACAWITPAWMIVQAGFPDDRNNSRPTFVIQRDSPRDLDIRELNRIMRLQDRRTEWHLRQRQ